MKSHVLFRKVHHWGSILIAVPILITLLTGLLLLVKKEVEWIQPPTRTGSAPQTIAQQTLQDMFNAARAVEDVGIDSWRDIRRLDVKPDKGVVKIVSRTNWEVQIDTATGDVLQVAYRRSDIIESLHDGSFWADWTKLGIWLPAGVGLVVLWLTGIYLFIRHQGKRMRRRNTKQTRRSKLTGNSQETV